MQHPIISRKREKINRNVEIGTENILINRSKTYFFNHIINLNITSAAIGTKNSQKMSGCANNKNRGTPTRNIKRTNPADIRLPPTSLLSASFVL